MGVFVKTHRSFLELRPLTKWVAVGFRLGNDYQKIKLRSPDDLDEEAKARLAAAYRQNVTGP